MNRGHARWRDRVDTRISKKQKRILTAEEELESKFGFDLFTRGDKCLGWLLNFSPSSWEDQETHKEYSCVDLYFVCQDGSAFKVKDKFRPYFYAATKDKMEMDVEAYLRRRYENQIADIEILEKEDLDLKNHLSGLRRSYLKIYFDTVQQLGHIKKDLMHIVERNKAKSDASEAYNFLLSGKSKQGPQDFIDCIIDLREYDVPYYVRFAIDKDIRCGQWYDVLVSSDGVVLEKRTDLLQRAEVRVCAFDIETTKPPLKFPDAEKDLVMMISYMVDGQGYLITNRERVGENIEDFEYTPKPEFKGCFKVTNVQNEHALLKHWFTHMQELKPGIYVTYNGDFFDWPFLERRAAVHGISMNNELGFQCDKLQGECRAKFACHLDCFAWVKRDSYLPQGSQGLKAVTKAKLGYFPLEINPEDMVCFAQEKPQMMASYSVSDAVATYYLYMTYVHPFIFSLATIIPMPPDEVLRKGSGTLCEMLLMVQAYQANVICPNKHQSDPEKFHNGHLLESETYIGGHVECLETGVFRSDLPSSFKLDASAFELLINNLDRDLQYAIQIEGKMDLQSVTNYDEVKTAIAEKLKGLQNEPIREECPLIYHLDVAAMYPNIILTNRLQPQSILTDEICTACDFNRPGKNCLRKLKWVWRGETYMAKRSDYYHLRRQLESEMIDGQTSKSFLDLPRAEQQLKLKERLRQYSQKAYKRVLDKPVTEVRKAGICMRENPFYVDTVRSFRNRRYEYKTLNKVWKGKLSEAKASGNSIKIQEAQDLVVLYDSLQLAHKCILNSFYGYVMRKGARWFSMEMAGVVTYTGAKIIQNARLLIERIGRPLELDTDGIWCVLPGSFPENFTFKTKDPKKKLTISYPCVMLNVDVARNNTNDQYQTLEDAFNKKYVTSSECSIEFEVDGPYKAMILPASKEEGILIKKRYAVFNNDGTLAELKGFEIKRRGELKLIKEFQAELFGKFLYGSTLEECYSAVASVANHWLDLLDNQFKDAADVELLDYLSESSTMSKSLAEYGQQKSCAVTTAKRLADFLGGAVVKDKGLLCRYVVACEPKMMASYSVSDAVATYYLYMTYVHPFIFSLATIIPMPPDEVLRKGSGTLCEMLLMVQAYQANVICPNKHQSDPEKFHNGHLLESETYIGGHVECLETGVFRSDLPSSFKLDASAFELLINNLDRDLQYAIQIEGKMDLQSVTNYDEVKTAIAEKLKGLQNEPIREECPLIYHLDVAAMYPNIILTNRLQVANPVPRVLHPDWLHKKVREKDDKFRQRKLPDVFSSLKKDAVENVDNNKKDEINSASIDLIVGDLEDLHSHGKPSKMGVRPIVRLYGPNVDRDSATATSQVNTISEKICHNANEVMLSASPEQATNIEENIEPSADYKGWLEVRKRKWRETREKRKRQRLENSKRINIHNSLNEVTGGMVDQRITKSRTNINSYFEEQRTTLTCNHWQIVQLIPSSQHGKFFAWAVVGGEMHKIPLVVPRVFYLNSKAPITEFPGGRVNKVLPHGRHTYNLIEVKFNEDRYIAESRLLEAFLANPEVEGIYETKIPLELSAVLQLGCVCKVDENVKKSNGQDWYLSDLHTKTTTECPYLEQSMSFFYLYHSISKGRAIYAVYFSASRTICVIIVNPNLRKGQKKGQNMDLSPKKLEILFRKVTNSQSLDLYVSKDGLKVDYVEHIKDAEEHLQEIISEFRNRNRIPMIALIECPNPDLIKSSVEALDDFPCVTSPSNARDWLYPDLGWQIYVAEIALQKCAASCSWLNHRILLSRYAHVPLGNLEVDSILHTMDILYSRSLRDQQQVLWISDNGIPDLGGIIDETICFLDEVNQPILTYPGAYRKISVEFKIQHLALNALLKSSQVNEMEGGALFGMDQDFNSAAELLGEQYCVDEVTSCAPAFRVLQQLTQKFLRDAQTSGNTFADQILHHLYRWLCSPKSKLHDPALHRMLYKIMQKVFALLMAEFRKLGATVVYASFLKVIIDTGKTDPAAAKAYCESVLKTLKARELFEWIELEPSQYWSSLLFMDLYNYGGIQAKFPVVEDEPQLEILSFWDIAESLPELMQEQFNTVVAKFIYDPWKYAREEATNREAASTGNSCTPSITGAAAEVVELRTTEKLKKMIKSYLDMLLNIVNNEHQVLKGDDSSQKGNPSLEFIKHVCAVLSLDQNVQHEVLIMRRNLLKSVRVREFAREAEFQSLSLEFIIPDVICSFCNDHRDLHLGRDRALLDKRWHCTAPQCGQQYDTEVMENTLLQIMRQRERLYHLQDLVCIKCNLVKAAHISEHCICAGSFRCKEDISDFRNTMRLFLDIATRQKFQLLQECCSRILE